MTLGGRAAVVTGSTSGIGLAIAEALAAQGADVLINGLVAHVDEGRAIAQRVAERYGVRAIFHGADMTRPDEIGAMVETAVRELGGLHILMNNAGVQHTARIDNFPAEKWDAIIAINLSAAFHASRAALPHMRSGGWGRIINTASVHGIVGSVEKGAYVAAKHAIVGLTKVVALENADRGITCNAICPGFVKTPLIQAQIDALAAHENVSADRAAELLVGSKQPSKGFVYPEQIAAMVVFLSSEAASQITGAALPIDGGWTAQ